MNYWLSYRKGSFWLKERFPCQRTAVGRIEKLAPTVGVVEMFDPEKLSARRIDPLDGAMEFDATTCKLVFKR